MNQRELRELLLELARMLADPVARLCLWCSVLLVGLFVLGIVRRRHPSPAVLLGVSLLGGSGSAWLFRSHDDTPMALLGSAVWQGCGAWFFLAVPIALTAVLQPGEPAPLDLGRATRHLVPALVGSLLLGLAELDVAWLGMPVVLVALCASRTSARVERAWRTAAILHGAHAALAGGTVLVTSLFDRYDVPVLAFELWVGVQALMAGLELAGSPGPSAPHRLGRWVPSLGLLALVGALGSLWRFPIDRQVAWQAFGRSLPPCRERMNYGLPDGPDPLLVLDATEDLAPHLHGSPLHLACAQQGRRRYGAVFIGPGEGVELRRIDGRVVMANGQPPDDAAVLEASLSCGIAPEIAPRGEDWTAETVTSWCDHPWRCVTGERVCTFSEKEGWHLE